MEEMTLLQFQTWKKKFREEHKNIELRFSMHRISGQKNIVVKEDRIGRVMYRADVTVNMEKKRSKWTYSLEEALQARDELESKRVLPSYRNGKELKPKIRFGALLNTFIERRSTIGSPTYRAHVVRLINVFSSFKDFYTHELTTDMFNIIFSSDRGKKTTSKYVGLLKDLKNLALSLGYDFPVDTDLLTTKKNSIPAKRSNLSDIKFCSSDDLGEIARAFAKIKRPSMPSYEVYEDIFTFSRLTSLRIGELLGLAWENVDLNSLKIHVRKQSFSDPRIIAQNNGSFFGSPKHNVERSISLPSDALKILKKYEAYRDPQYACENFNLVFPAFIHERRVDRPITYKNIETFWIKNIRPLISNKEISIHSFRHTFATWFLNKYGDSVTTLTELRDIMGHGDFKIVQVYAQALEANREHKMFNFSYDQEIKKGSTKDDSKKIDLIEKQIKASEELLKKGFTPDQIAMILGSVMNL